MYEDKFIEDFAEMLNKQASIYDLDIIEAEEYFDEIKVIVAYPDITKIKDEFFVPASMWMKELLNSREWLELAKSSEPVFDANIENFIKESEDSYRAEFSTMVRDVEEYISNLSEHYTEDALTEQECYCGNYCESPNDEDSCLSGGVGSIEVTVNAVLSHDREFITREWLFEEYKKANSRRGGK